ncbi:Protein CBG01204 [Caenorhabditis briggsae]|uniref:Protein CBG01204 n=1 Tax=Caenorhabditis briggsae TaxID=6238 RepID=A8WPU2_CAEBR|nr:Protein CBG01204 [Caenorhabditis briggsae]CAP22499.1 Protein CBG01204 [Caenorhabditis briggsae]
MKSALLILVIVGCGSAQFSTSGRANITKVHNDLRSAVAKGTYTAKGTLEPAAVNMREMKWDTYLGSSAQEHADKCPNSHSNAEGVGENFYTIWYAQSPNLDNSGVETSKAWAKEFQNIELRKGCKTI